MVKHHVTPRRLFIVIRHTPLLTGKINKKIPAQTQCVEVGHLEVSVQRVAAYMQVTAATLDLSTHNPDCSLHQWQASGSPVPRPIKRSISRRFYCYSIKASVASVELRFMRFKAATCSRSSLCTFLNMIHGGAKVFLGYKATVKKLRIKGPRIPSSLRCRTAGMDFGRRLRQTPDP